MQKDLQNFEKNLAAFLNIKYVFGVANGTDALVIALKAVGVKPGDEVILPSHTYISTAASVHFVGATPVLAEIGSDHMLAPDLIERHINKKTTAIMPVQVNGRTCNMREICAIAEKHDLKIIEDAAQGLGSKFEGHYAGTFGMAGTFSFYPAKLLGCFGDGGAIVTNDEGVAKKIALLRDHGRDENGRVVDWGFNSRLDNLQAAILDFKLKSYPNDIKRRRDIASKYNFGLHRLKELKLPPAPEKNISNFDVYQNYEIESSSRDALRSFLDNNGIKTIIQWAGTPVHKFKELGFNNKLPITDALFSKCLMLPMYPTLNDNEVDYIVKKINEFYS